jgi:small subunit ribosomal protein S20
LANHKSALKRARQNEVRKIRNLSYKTRSKKAVKAVRSAIAGNSGDQAKENLRTAISTLQKGTSKGVIHKNKTSRKISRLNRQVNRVISLAAESSAKG